MSIRGAPVKLIGVVAAAVLAVVVLSTAYSTSILLAADDCSDTEPSELLTLHAYPDPEGIRICWGSNPPEIRGYEIWRGTTEDTIRGYMSAHWGTNYGAQWVEYPIPTSWVDLNTTPGQEYWYRVVLLDGNYEDGRKGDKIATTTNVSMIAPNEAPSFDAPTATRTIDENTAADQPIGAPVEATDIDVGDTTLTYSLDSASTAVFDIDSNGQLKTKAALDHETKDTYSVTVTARDRGGLTGSIDVTISVGDVNEAPEFASATATRTIPENTVAGTNIGDPVGANDQDTGDILTYSLDVASAAVFDIDSTGQLKTKTSLDHETKGSYTVTVSVRDSRDDSGSPDTADDATIEVTITVTDVNEAPAFPASETGTRSIPENTAAGQNIGAAVEAKDPDEGDTLTYSLGGTDAGSFDFDTSTGQIKTKDALDFEMKASYEVTVSVRDSRDGSGSPDTAVDATQNVTITVDDSNEDIALSGDTSPNYPENGTGDVATYTATDGDGGTIIWNLSGDDASLFNFTGGVLTFKSSPDYEMPTDQGPDNKYQVTVQASTSNDTPATLAVTITVTDANEAPAFPSDEDGTRTVRENTASGQPIGAPVAAVDPDAAASLTYDLGGTDVASFDIDTSTGQLKTKVALDFESGTTSYEVTVTASDTDAGTADATVTVTITVTDANDAPTFNAGLATALDVDENTVAGTNIGAAFTATDEDTSDALTYSLDATSAAVFDIDSSGQLKTKAPLDYERKTSYTVTVSVRDSRDVHGTADTAADDSITVTVNVTNLDEDGTITLSSRQPQVSTEFTATLSDPAVAGPIIATWAWEKSADKTTWTTISSAADSAYTPVVEDVGSYLQVTAMYNDGQGGTDKSAQTVSEFPVRAAPTGINTAPTFTDGDPTSRNILEGIQADRNIGNPVSATDVDADDINKLTYQLGGTDAESFDIDIASGQLKTKDALDYDTKSAYEITVTVVDPSLDSDSITVNINVTRYVPPRRNPGGSSSNTPTNSKPAFDESGPVQRSMAENTEPGVAVGEPVTATDVDDTQLAYAIQASSDGASFDIDTSSGQLKTKAGLDYEVKDSYSLTLTVTDGKNANGNSDTTVDDTVIVSITVTDANDAPAFASETATREVAENTASGQNIGDAFTATDQDAGDTLTYTLDEKSATVFNIDSSSGQLKTKASLDYEVKATYLVTLSVTDGKNANGNIDTTVDDTVTVAITVTDANDPPAFASETATREVAENTATGQNIGDAFMATDQDAADALTYTLDEKSATVFNIDSSSGQLKTKASLDYETKASYSVTLSVTDGENANGNIDTTVDDTVTVTITVIDANDPPAFASETATREVAENTASGQNIGDAFTATDQDAGDTLTYTLDEKSATVFNIDSSSGQLKTKASLDYEVKATYLVTLSVTDGKNANGNIDTTVDDTVTVAITVTDANDPPAFASETATREVAENTATGQNIGDAFMATDQDAADALTYTLDEKSATVFNIDSSSGQLKTKASLDYETKASYSVTLSVTDGENANGNIDTTVDDTVTVTITVIDANDPPAFASETATREVAENTASGQNIGDAFTATDQDAGDTLTYTLDETSAAVFDIDANGQLKTKASLDYETKASYSVTLSVTDGKNANGNTDTTADDTVIVSITVTDANDAPAFASETATREVAENTATGQNIGDAFTATDQDAGDTLTYTLDETSATVFDIDSSSGQLKTKAPLDHDTTPSYTVTISVRDSRDAEGNTDAVADDTITVTVNVDQVQSTNPPPTPPVTQRGRSTGGVGGGVYSKSEPTNPEPEFHQSGSVLLSVPENAEPGTAIGDPITATDDDDEELVYSIQAGQDGAHFAIDSSNGQLKTKGPLDYEARTQYQLRMQVKDDDGGTDRISVQIRVTGVPEPPELTGDTEVEVAENATGRLAEYTASDPEGQAITWGLSGDDADDFSMANGVLSFTTAPDYDAPADSDGDNVYRVTVEASDGTDSSTLEVTVTVTNLIDDFRVQGSARGSATESNTGSDGLAIAMRSLSYPENGTAAVATYAAVEPAGDQIAWSLAGNDGDLFSIGNGILSFDDPPDYEAPADSDEDNAYVVTVQANDGTDSASLDVTISVTDVNEGPTLTSQPATVDYDEQGTGSVATYTATDPEGDDLDWSLSGGDAGAFSIDEGALSFTSSPNYEEPSDSDKDNVYDVTVEASDGTYSDSADVSVTVTDVQEVPITNPATQAVGTVPTGSETTIKTPDDAASVTFPASSRANIYMARVDSDLANCSAASTEDGSPDPIDGDLRVCLTVAIFDTWGNEEQDATLAQPASVSLMMDADDLGGVEMVQEAYDQGGINIYTRGGANDEWSTVEFTLTADEEGTVIITVSGVTQFSSFAAATDADVFNQLMAPPLTPTPTPTPTPRQQQTGSGPVSMMSGTGIIKMPPRPPSTPMAVPAPSTDGIPPDAPPVAQAASVEPVVLDVVENAPLWALIVLIMGSVMCASGTGMVAYSRLTAPPPWMRVPGAEVKGVKRRV